MGGAASWERAVRRERANRQVRAARWERADIIQMTGEDG